MRVIVWNIATTRHIFVVKAGLDVLTDQNEMCLRRYSIPLSSKSAGMLQASRREPGQVSRFACQLPYWRTDRAVYTVESSNFAEAPWVTKSNTAERCCT